MTALATPRRTHGGSTQTVTNPATGNRLRIVRAREADTFRTVHLVTEAGLVEIGRVVMLSPHEGFAHPVDDLPRHGWACTSFTGGAVQLDQHVEATPVTSYLLTIRTSAPRAVTTHTEEATDARQHA